MKHSRCTRRSFLKAAAAAAAFGPGALAAMAKAPPKTLSGSKPNIIFILTDDASHGDLSSYGQKHFRTPNLDRLARGGLRFRQAYAGSPECAPSRASFVTGMHMGHCRIRANRSVRGQDHLLAEDVTVGEVLKRAGYATGFVGKWGVGLPGTPGEPHKQGFDYAYGFYDQARAHGYYPDFMMENGKRIVLPENHGFNMSRVYAYNRRPAGRLKGVENRYDDRGRLVPDGVADPAKAKNSQTLIQQAALGFLRRNHKRPFFLYYATQIPHGPVITPDLGEYKDKPWSLKHKEWAAMMAHLDRGAGRMLALLKELGVEKNTVIFYAADNGYSQWGYFARKAWLDDPLFKNKGPWRAGKFICREGGVRVPLFANWPGRIKAGQSDHICALYDFLATAADLAGVKLPHKTDGISFAAELAGRADLQAKHEYLYWENGSRNNHAQAVRMGRWRAFRPHPSRPTELYDLEKDVACRRDLAKDHPDVVARIERIFKAAHTDSQWYVNPGQPKASIEAKRKQARAAGQLQTPRRANSTYTRRK